MAAPVEVVVALLVRALVDVEARDVVLPVEEEVVAAEDVVKVVGSLAALDPHRIDKHRCWAAAFWVFAAMQFFCHCSHL